MLLRRKQERAECKEDFSTAFEMTVSGGWITHVPYKGYVGKTPLPQRHPERSRGIFFAHRYSAVCETAENGNASVKGARKNKVQGRFLDCTRNDGMGDGFISRSVQRICIGKRYSCIVIPSEAEGSFLQEGIMSYV